MSQVGQQQRVSSIESEQTKSSVGGGIGDGGDGVGGGGGAVSEGGKSKKSKAQRKSGDCEVLDTHALIDAGNVATQASKEQPLQQPLKTSECAKANLQQKELHGADASHKFDKTNYQSAELNNNSIPPQPSAADQGAAQKPLETPISLLTGLRMHTSNLRAAQKSADQAAAQVTSRKPLIKKSEQEPQQLQQQHLNAPGSPSNVKSSTTASYVESSLNPPDTPVSKVAGAAASPHSPYIPSYTSLFNYQKPSVTTPSPSPDQPPAGAKPPAPHSTSSYSQQNLFSESVKKTTTTSSCRSPLIKRPADQQPSDLSARNLLTSANKHLETAKRLPTIFDQSRGRLREPIDYDESTADRRRRLQRLAANDCENIIDYQDEEKIVDEDGVEHDELDYQERGLDDQSVSSAYSGTQPARSLLSNLREQSGKQHTAINSSPESQKTGATHLIHQPSKHSASGNSKLASATRNRGRNPARAREQSSSRISMGSQQQLGSGKKLAHGQQTQSQTRISMNEMSRPPSFNTTTQQLDGHDMKSASCRKLDLLEQAAHLDCACQACSKNRKLADNLYHYHGHHQLGSASKLPNLKLNKTGDKSYPKTRVMHMVLKSIILVLCTLLLLLLLVGTIMLSIHLPQSMDKVVGATRQFNVTIAGRR